MGEWSEYFEDFPEENPANWIDGRFDPAAAKRLGKPIENWLGSRLNSTLK